MNSVPLDYVVVLFILTIIAFVFGYVVSWNNHRMYAKTNASVLNNMEAIVAKQASVIDQLSPGTRVTRTVKEDVDATGVHAPLDDEALANNESRLGIWLANGGPKGE